MKTKTNISPLSRVLLILAGLLLSCSIFVPIWQIDLDAPQYPEGLRLLIYSDKLGGNVDIINGLNHYIGMKTLHAEEFVEFTVLPYIIGFYALLSILTAMTGKTKMLYTLFALFVLFGIVAMVDFYRWEYNYGHNLDPNAAIIVPGMAYQPPLIGFKQLLNFGAYSVPALGGWLFIGSGLLMASAIVIEKKFFRKSPKTVAATSVLALFMLGSCSPAEPEPIKLNSDNCHFCKMTIADLRFASELLTSKGRVYKFDDISCLINFVKEDEKMRTAKAYVSDYAKPDSFISATGAQFVKAEAIASPMGGNTAAFAEAGTAADYQQRFSGQLLSWQDLQN